MLERIGTLTTKYGGKTMKKKEKAIMNKELRLKLKDNLVITSLNEEGLVFDLDTWRTFWINETAVFFLKLLQTNCEGISLSSAVKLPQRQYFINGRNKVKEDFDSFINRLEQFDLMFFRPASNGVKSKNLNSSTKRPYIRPIIKEEVNVVPIQGSQFRAAHMAAARSAAVSRATVAGFRGFR